MAEFTTARLDLPRWTEPTDTPNRTEFDAAFASLEAAAAGFLEGPVAERPVASADLARFLHYAPDVANVADRLTVCVDTTGAGGWSWESASDGRLKLTGGTMTGPLLLPDGTDTKPSLAFSRWPDTGFWASSTLPIIVASISGVAALALRSDYLDPGGGGRDGLSDLGRTGSRWRDLYLSGVVRAGDGSSSAPGLAFGSSPDTGLTRATSLLRLISNAFAVAEAYNDGTLRSLRPGLTDTVELGTTGRAWKRVLTVSGNPIDPPYSFGSDPDTGWYNPAADVMYLSLGGVRRAGFISGGDLFLWGTAAVANGANARGIRLNSACTPTHASMDFGSSAEPWRNIYATNGTIQTSDLDAKADVAAIGRAEALDRVLRVADEAVVSFRWPDGTRRHAGFSAQDVGRIHGESSAAYIDPSVEANGRSNPYQRAQPTAAWYADHVADGAEGDEAAEQRAAAEVAWVEAREAFDADTTAMRQAPKGLRPAELVPDLYVALAAQQRQLDAQGQLIADLTARLEVLEQA